jgi:hypothetical protein
MDQENDLALLKLYGSLNLITAFSRKKNVFLAKHSVIIQLKLKGSMSNNVKLSDP